ncbi:SOS response-associated peptidase [Larkinella soli]|uniref:SOS response-associated peptidase n=1 Tax=Larkinella soli TaxID=1770527 RepID=UPI000FFB163C|nr:SOS response-associated peptidase [Larkinella soli]
MCYHKNLNVSPQELQERYDADLPPGADFGPIFHASAFAFPHWPILTHQQPGQFRMLQWGLIPHWVRGRDQAEELKARTLNAQSETIFEKPSFRGAAQGGKRCLIPVTGFFEWFTQKSKKYPFYIHPRSQKIVSIAGLWDEWTDRDTGEVLQTYTLLTTEANPLLAKIHNTKRRMPVLLTTEAEKAWLRNDLSEKETLAICADPYPDRELESYTITKRITARGEPTDVPEVLEPAAYPEMKF